MDILSENDFILQKRIRHTTQFLEIGLKNVFSPLIRALDQFPNLLVDDAGRFLAVRLGKRLVASAIIVTSVANFFVQSVDTYHRIGLFCNFFEVA